MKVKCLLIFIAFSFSYNFCKSQSFSINPMYYQNFDKDSLSGFDEIAARTSAISQHLYGAEFKEQMYRLKRQYIDDKYSLTKPVTNGVTIEQYLFTHRPAATPGCTNEDFEASTPGQITSSTQIAGWTITKGYNGNPNTATGPNASVTAFYTNFPGGVPSSCNLITCCPVPPGHSELIDCSAPGGYIDNQIGTQYPIYSVFGSGPQNSLALAVNPQLNSPMFGTKVLRLNDGVTGDYSIERLSKTFSVSANNALFQFAFLSVFATNHACCDAGVFVIKLSNATTNTVLPCPSFSVSAPSIQCNGTVGVLDYFVSGSNTTYTYNAGGSNGSIIYNKWKINLIDLTAYIGQNITIDIIVSDCTFGGHNGKVYFDAQCSALKVNINNSDYITTDSILNFNTCDTLAKLQAPANFSSYQWNGPFGISSTNSILTTTSAGMYTLTLNEASLCSPITKTVHVVFAQQLANIVSSHSVLCEGSSAVLSITGLNSGVWNTGSTSPSITVSPSITTTYSYNALSSFGCFTSASLLLKVEDCTGLKSYSNSNKNISIYPNPNRGEFIMDIEMKLDKAVLSIETSLGQSVYKQSVQQGNNTIKTKGLIAGIYYYTLTENEKIIYKGKLQIE